MKDSEDEPETIYVYLLGPYEGCYKIGFAYDPESRLHELHPRREVRIVHQFPSAKPRDIARYLREAFSKRRVDEEWFRLEDSEMSLFCCVQRADAVSDLPPAIVSLGAESKPVKVPAKRGRKKPTDFRLTEEEVALLDAIAETEAKRTRIPCSRSDALKIAAEIHAKRWGSW